MALDYDIKTGTHRSAEEEWEPHIPMAPNFEEWHYFTANMTGDNGHRYFMFLCDFNFAAEDTRSAIPFKSPKNKTLYLNMFLFKDYNDGVFHFERFPTITNPENVFDKVNNTLQLPGIFGKNDVHFQYKGDTVYIRSRNPAFTCELNCTGGSRVMWMKDTLHVDGFIREGGEADRSFYYSLPELPFTGTVSYRDSAGKKQCVRMTGEGWIDRQWGDYSHTKSWDWVSFRFSNGDRINTYSFYNGYQIGVLQRPDGSMEYFDSFQVVPTGYCYTPKKHVQISCGWEYTLPVKERYYRLEPLSNDTISEGYGNDFYEGLCRIYNKNHDMVGWAVAESMSTEIMHNGPSVL